LAAEFLKNFTQEFATRLFVPSLSALLLHCFYISESVLQRARELYFKDWDPVRNPLPDNRQVHITQLKTSEVVVLMI
jgi:hypothetical protein